MAPDSIVDQEFWGGKRVLLTGFTGFKGGWLWLWLQRMGARLTGLALPADPRESLSAILGLDQNPDAVLGDIRDRQLVEATVSRCDPQIVIHLAAQALVRRSYKEPLYTFDVNVQGTLVLLEALRSARDLKACLIVTSDKVYRNDASGRRFAETDPLGGTDPYSASKAACEMAVAAYAQSVFGDGAGRPRRIATARAGNVIGGGDWSADRLIPDIWRARRKNHPVVLRFPGSTRPWQHVLDPLAGYLAYAQHLCAGSKVAALNFGPHEPARGLDVAAVAELFARTYRPSGFAAWVAAAGDHPAEARDLAIDSRMAQKVLGWRTRLDQQEAIDWTARWYASHDEGQDMVAFCHRQIDAYEARLAQAGRHHMASART